MADGSPIQDRITGFWSTVARDYEAHEGNVPAPGSAEADAWVDAIRRLLPPPPADVLDIATGTGYVALIAASLGHRVMGIDLSPHMLSEAREAATRASIPITFAEADAVDPALPPASFDAVICRHFLWTLRDPARAFAAWHRLLRPGGRVVAIDGFWQSAEEPAPREEPEQLDESPGLFEQFYTPETRAALPIMNLSSPDQVVRWFHQAEFERVEVTYLADVHVLAEDPPSRDPWYVIVATKEI